MVPNDDSVQLLSHKLEDFDDTLPYQAYSAKDRKLQITARLPVSAPVFWQRHVRKSFLSEDMPARATGELSKETVFIDGTK